jgi:hypothetical protein
MWVLSAQPPQRSSILFVGTELTPQFHFTPYDCYLWQVWQGLGALLVAAALDIILVLRGACPAPPHVRALTGAVYAMYAQARVVLVVLGAAFVLEMAGMITSLAMAVPGIRYTDICTVTAVPSSILLYGCVWRHPRRLLTDGHTARRRSCSSCSCSCSRASSSSQASAAGGAARRSPRSSRATGRGRSCSSSVRAPAAGCAMHVA